MRRSSHRRSTHKKKSSKHPSNKRRSARRVKSAKHPSNKRRSARRSNKRRSARKQKGGDLDLFKSLVTNPLSKSSNLISNLKDHNVLVDRFDDMKNQISKLTKRVEQLESALSKLQK